ncbi:glutathione S-transferase family protein [uncultured Planktomarina sp.]|uniref:glutathione S-transferase family protein n=1 Tax=uncultured Planktomarina sp. TaxID=1538529 RepID=UPI003260721D
MLKLFAAKHTVSLASALILEELGTEYELCLVDIAARAQREKPYLDINPKGRVPTLVTPDGILTETGAILEYIAPNLMPEDAFTCAKIREFMHNLAATMHVNHAHKLRGKRWADLKESRADMTAKVPQTMSQSCAYVETLIMGPYIFGSEITIADAHLFTLSQWLEGDGVDINIYPKLAAFERAFAARPSVAAVHAKGLL